MIRLLAQTGGRKVKNEDLLDYIQSFDLFEGLFEELGLNGVIVFGCEITGGGPYNISAGIIYFNDILRIVDAAVGVALPYELVEDSIEINLRTFEDGLDKYTAEALKLVPGSPSDFDLDQSTVRIGDALFGPDPVKTKIVNTGDWNMNVSVAGALQLTVAHGITDFTKIRSVKAMILADNDSARAGSVYDFESPADVTGVGAGLTGKAWDVTNVYLRSIAASFFDHADFNKLAFNRGYIVITYID